MAGGMKRPVVKTATSQTAPAHARPRIGRRAADECVTCLLNVSSCPPEVCFLAHDPPKCERFGEKIMRILNILERDRTQNRKSVLLIVL
jgi:hypothetical protein